MSENIEVDISDLDEDLTHQIAVYALSSAAAFAASKAAARLYKLAIVAYRTRALQA